MRRFKDVRRGFERGSECLEGALVRNAQAPRGKQHEVEEASNALLNARKTFRSEALDYVLEVRKNAGRSKNTDYFFTLCWATGIKECALDSLSHCILPGTALYLALLYIFGISLNHIFHLSVLLFLA